MNILLVSPQLAVKVESLPALLAHRVLGLLVHLVDVLAEVRVFLVADLTLQLKTNVGHIMRWTSLENRMGRLGLYEPHHGH